MATSANSSAIAAAQDPEEPFEVLLPPPGRGDDHGSFDPHSSTPRSANVPPKPRAEVHRDGDWHSSAHVWLLDPKGRVLLQKRSMRKDTFPGRWDISAAGHIAYGETPRATAVKETAEELGVDLRDDGREGGGDGPDLHFAFCVPAEMAHAGGCNCYEYVYLVIWDPSQSTRDLGDGGGHDIAETIGTAEVDEVRWVDLGWLEEALSRNDPTVVPRTPAYGPLFFAAARELIARHHDGSSYLSLPSSAS